jgi:RHS repeat-associated protein
MTGDQAAKQFVYDAWNRLVAVKNLSGTTLETLGYDGLGRIIRTASGTTTDLYYSDQGQVLEEFVGGTAMARYVWSPVYVNALVLRDRNTGSGTLSERLWVQQDANWNVTALVNSSGVVVERYAYTPYGEVTIYNASYAVQASSAYGWVYGFQGMRFDAISGFNETDTRPYSPTLGRWTTMDPLGFRAGDVNLYRAEGNNTVRYVDPTGMSFRDWWLRNGVGNRLEGAVRLVGGASMVYAGVGVAVGGTILGAGVGGVVAIPVGGTIAIVGADQAIAGFRSVLDGQEHASFIAQGINGIAGSGGETYDTVAQFAAVWRGIGAIGVYGVSKFGPGLDLPWC